MKALNTEKAPAAIGPYSQAIEVNGMVFTSGQLPIDPATGAFPEGGIKEQTRQSLLNIKAILNSEGLDNASFFSMPYPGRSAVAVKTLPKNALVEIECIAAR